METELRTGNRGIPRIELNDVELVACNKKCSEVMKRRENRKQNNRGTTINRK